MNLYKITWAREEVSFYLAAYNVLDAIKTFCINYPFNIEDFSIDDEILQIPKEKWDEKTRELIRGKIDSFIL